jgi:MinD-like ATPase involved in chromosome partitioning or flagellar assembly
VSDSGKPQPIVDTNNGVPKKQPSKDVAALFTNLKLQHEHYQPFTRRQTPKLMPQVEEIPVTAPVERVRTHIGIFSPAGGSGKSLLASGIGSVLCQLGKRVLLVDAAPWQSLAFHFGAKENRAGRRAFFAPGVRKTPVYLLSCGENQAGFPDLTEFDTAFPVDYVLFDLSGISGNLLLNYLRECDRVLVPLLPDPSALRNASTVVSMLESLGSAAPQVRFIINNMDDSAASTAVREALSRLLGNDLFSSVIFSQPEVRRALQDGIVLPFHTPEAQASLVLGELAHSFISPEKVSVSSDSRWIEG